MNFMEEDDELGTERISERRKQIRRVARLVANRSKAFSKLMQIYRLDRLPKPSLRILRAYLNGYVGLRPNLELLARGELFGEGIVRGKFGLDVSGLMRVWQKVGDGFAAVLANSEVRKCGLQADEVFLMTLQHFREYRKLQSLGLDWGIHAGHCAELLWLATSVLRSELSKHHAFPPRFEDLKLKKSKTLGFRWVGAIDCRWLRRRRIHPGQKDLYRMDKKSHGLSASMLCDVDGTILRSEIRCCCC